MLPRAFPAGFLSLLVPVALGLAARAADATAQPPLIAVAKVSRGELSQTVSFDAELRPFQEIELHAKVSGYLDGLNVDAGDRVKAGQVIGTLEVPELRADLEHAVAAERRSVAEVERALAHAEEAKLAFTRLEATSKSQRGLIAAQELDAAKARAHSAEASLASARESAKVAQADVKKYQTMVGYTRITAPFDGVVTRRHVSPGALIQGGTGGGAMPLVRLSQSDLLRVVFPISLSFVSRVKLGDAVEIRIPSAGRNLSGRVARFSRKVETSTRTMEVEADLTNADLSLIPGIYATVVLKLDQKENALVVPVESVSRGKTGATVYVVTGDRKIEERAVTLGVETPARLEIVQGLKEGELLMIGSRAQVKPGQVVAVKLVENAKAD